MRGFSWKVSDCEELMWDDIQLPVQSVIRIFLTKKQSRLESQFPGDCMDNAYKFADKFADKWTFEKVANQQTLGNAGGSAGSRTPDHLIKSQMLYQLSYRPNATISVTYGDSAYFNSM